MAGKGSRRGEIGKGKVYSFVTGMDGREGGRERDERGFVDLKGKEGNLGKEVLGI